MKVLKIGLAILTTIALFSTLILTAVMFYSTANVNARTQKNAKSVLLPETDSLVACPKLNAAQQKLAVYLANSAGVAEGIYTQVSGAGKSPLAGSGIEMLDTGSGGIITASPKTGRNTAIIAATWAENTGKNPGTYLSQCKESMQVARYLSSGSEVGKTHNLVLINPYERPVKATVTVWSERGREKNQKFINVAAKSQQNLVLDAFYPQRKRLMIQVEAEGKGIISFLNETAEAGLKDLGSTQVEMLGKANRELRIPAQKLGETPEIWIYNPHKKPVKYQVNLYDDKGVTKLQDGKEFKVLGEAIFSLPLAGYNGMQATIGISADNSLQAALYQPYQLSDKRLSYTVIPALDQLDRGVLFAAAETKVKLVAQAVKATQVTLKSISNPQLKPITINLEANQLFSQDLPTGIWEWQATNSISVVTEYAIGNSELPLPSFPLPTENSEIEVAVSP